MANLLGINEDDIAQLLDADLRSLIGLLCEADYRLAGLPTKGITWGGHQDAGDGGLDVVIRGEEVPPTTSYIPRRVTGFQVKKPDMPPAEIKKEMRPKNVLREEIKNLIREGGAYIIVSSTASTTNTTLTNRISAMKEAVIDIENHENLALDFMDRGRVATWVRSHPWLILWVRNKIGRQLRGWRPYENWANAPDGIEEEYLFDKGLRLYDGTKSRDRSISVEDGLLRLRKILNRPGKSVRLAGLSGVGKTRLVQALFDGRIGEDALNPINAFYTDSGSPDPDPQTFAEQLIALRTQAILIIDNCPPDLHRRLTQTCVANESTISLLTVEYDVREDIPHETNVFRLEPASEELIEKLIDKRFSHISQVDARTIATFSGGNARLAIALATTVQRDETLSGFSDEELFQRLFKQRHDPSESLLRSAEVCSLVYSFEGEDTTSANSELNFLASLIGKTAQELFRDVNILKKRDLVQSRHVWRAVLPHALANRLAKQALEFIPKDTLLAAFMGCNSERLITSFTRRLSFLHDCEVAAKIATDWLAPHGWIGKNMGNLSNFGMGLFSNIAPIVPEKALEAIERVAHSDEGAQFTSREHVHYHQFVRLLKHIAYDPTLFTRSVKIMCRYALSEKLDENINSTRNILKSLFYIKLSGTHASVVSRAAIIEELVYTEDSNCQDLGILLLDATLETERFSADHEFDFGARPRDFGLYPQSRQDVTAWFGTFINICVKLSVSDQPIAIKARKTLSNNFQGLWTTAGMLDELENAARRIHEHKPWSEGWPSVRSILRNDSKRLDEEILERLCRLEQHLKPANLLERARVYALSNQYSSFDLEEDYEDESNVTEHQALIEKITREIGIEIAQAPETLAELLPDLVSTDNLRLFYFGKGLAEGCNNKQNLWQILYTQLATTPSEKRQVITLEGFLSECRESEPAFYHTIMDGLVTDILLGSWFPEIQINSTVDQWGLARLHRSLDAGLASINMYARLARHETISDDEISSLIKKIFVRENGVEVTIKLLRIRFHGAKGVPNEYSSSLLAIARDVLSAYPFDHKQAYHSKLDRDLSKIAEVCLRDEDGVPIAVSLLNRLEKALSQHHIYFFDYPDLLNVLAQLHPICFLDIFFQKTAKEDHRHRQVFFYNSKRHSNPLHRISEIDLLSWCDKEPESRYPLITWAIETYSESAETGKLEWRPIVYKIFERAPNLDVIFEKLQLLTHPIQISDSRATQLQKRSELFQRLYDHTNAQVRAWAQNMYTDLQESISKKLAWEESRKHERDESFE